MPRKISDKQLKNLVNDFKSGIIINNLIKTYGFTKATIIKYLKKNIQEDQYEVLVKNQLSHKGNLTKSNTIPGKDTTKSFDFLFTYGDGLSDVNIGELINFHKKNHSICTVTAVFPPSRFGALEIDENNNKVVSFI